MHHDVPTVTVLVVCGVGVDTIVRVPALPVPMADAVLDGPIERYLGHNGAGWALRAGRGSWPSRSERRSSPQLVVGS